MSLLSSLPILILMMGAAFLGFLLAWSIWSNQQEAINEHRARLLNENEQLKLEKDHYVNQTGILEEERHSMQQHLSDALNEKQLLRRQTEQLEKEKAFIIREFHELKAELRPGENTPMSRLQQELEQQEETMEELKKTIVFLNNELNSLKNKTSVNPSLDQSATKEAKDRLEKFK